MDYIDGDAIIPQASQLVVGGLAHGFQFVDEKIVYITESEIYQKKIKRKIRRQNISNAERLKNYNELEKGDYVVHQVHGIGQYLGIETIEISGVHRDYVSIQYQNGDRISIPVDQIQMISCAPLKKSKKIWNRIVRWTDCWLETSVLGKQRLLCEQPLRQ